MKPSQIARALGLHPTTVSRWGKKRPRYAVAYIELFAAHEELKAKLAEKPPWLVGDLPRTLSRKDKRALLMLNKERKNE